MLRHCTHLTCNDRLVYAVDTNSRIRRSIPRVTGAYSMYAHNCHGGDRLQELCENHALCIATTRFKPKRAKKRERGRGNDQGNAIFRPRNKLAKYSQIDHILVSEYLFKNIQNVSMLHSYKEYCGTEKISQTKFRSLDQLTMTTH